MKPGKRAEPERVYLAPVAPTDRCVLGLEKIRALLFGTFQKTATIPLRGQCKRTQRRIPLSADTSTS